MPSFLRSEVRAYMHEHGLLGPGPALVTRGYESLGVMPEYFPAGYDDFIMDVTTAHPQMMELFKKLFGDRFVLDHCLMLNRAAESRGRRWHAHQYREGQYEVEDPIGTGKALTPEFLQQQCIRTLCAIQKGQRVETVRNLGLSQDPTFTGSRLSGTQSDSMKTPTCKQIG